MGKSFTKLTIDGHFILVKGFLMGFWSTQTPQPRYFFHRNTGIHNETFKEIITEFFELKDEVSLCLESDAVPAFLQAVEEARPIIGISVTATDPVRTGEFKFSFKIHNREMGEACKVIFFNPPEGVKLRDFGPQEAVREEGKSDPHLHAYVYTGQGTATGDIGGIISLYLACKRSKASDLITTEDVLLDP